MIPLKQKEKFASQANPQLLKKMRTIAKREGRQFQAVLDDAMTLYVERETKREKILREAKKKMRPEVFESLKDSTDRFDTLLALLAK